MEASSVPAYAKLQGENFVYFIRTLSLTLGRRAPGMEGVDVDLGPSKNISRIHARIDYDFVSRQFKISPLGKNGIVVNGVDYPVGHFPIPLSSRYVPLRLTLLTLQGLLFRLAIFAFISFCRQEKYHTLSAQLTQPSN